MTKINHFMSIEELISRLEVDDPPQSKGPVQFELKHQPPPLEQSVLKSSTDGGRFLYRGQIRHWRPCQASIWRSPSIDQQRIDWALSQTRAAELEMILEGHPLLRLAGEYGIALEYEALFHHYGLNTAWLGFTSSLEVASIFATIEIKGNIFLPCNGGVGVIYRLDRETLRTNDRVVSVIYSPISRSARQQAWALYNEHWVDLDTMPGIEIFTFSQKRMDSNDIVHLVSLNLFQDDPIAEVVKGLLSQNQISSDGIRNAVLKSGQWPKDEIDFLSRLWAEQFRTKLGLQVVENSRFCLNPSQVSDGELNASIARAEFLSARKINWQH